MNKQDVKDQIKLIEQYLAEGFLTPELAKKRSLQVVENYRSFVTGNELRELLDDAKEVTVPKAGSESGSAHSRR